ncbi:MAG TPA: VOC family protein [Gaiellaceae bacterium]|jgi:catechol 2,3-dioxygenase-like lactoylglutathione lyase family enzyme|nr:VOC family protein [Gaiellaceae bacterium]
MKIWYRVSDLDAARAFYTQQLGFEELYVDEEDRWIRLERDGVEIAISDDEFEGRGDTDDEIVATIEVADIKAEAERLREAGVNVGVVVEIPGTIRLLDVFDPDGNRLQLTEDI